MAATKAELLLSALQISEPLAVFPTVLSPLEGYPKLEDLQLLLQNTAEGGGLLSGEIGDYGARRPDHGPVVGDHYSTQFYKRSGEERSVQTSLMMLHLPYNSVDRDRPLFQLRFTIFVTGMLLLPVTGLIVSLFISIVYHFEDANYTHCHVSNYLPSISAAISRVPELYIWRFCIGMHSAPRFLLAATYFNFYRGRFASKLPELLLSWLALACNLTENCALLLLTYVASTEIYTVHKGGFLTFIVSSQLYMLISCRLWYVIKSHCVNKQLFPCQEMISYKWKVHLLLCNLGCCVVAAYFFRRHNKHCEAGVYTLFALFEYLVVFSNMAFHTTSILDFEGKIRIEGEENEKRQEETEGDSCTERAGWRDEGHAGCKTWKEAGRREEKSRQSFEGSGRPESSAIAFGIYCEP
ncbi:post-GPI attachment to proteins factor 2-like isoform X4 [Syngnathus typhle]|uniref:post-GPI attachment to proteins factor 2-like isoform X4 n=1 Tax=Syngnathus typhle TaxID=161592 RepID=UPI002A6AF91E|nr:post-GPI attachment to proteins factor 2-like isoform X4 [Syngnathus typhle]